jgi:hypothetical protein
MKTIALMMTLALFAAGCAPADEETTAPYRIQSGAAVCDSPTAEFLFPDAVAPTEHVCIWSCGEDVTFARADAAAPWAIVEAVAAPCPYRPAPPRP